MNEYHAIQTFNSQDTDIIGYAGPVDRTGYDALCQILSASPKKKNCMFAISTLGGDPNAGFRIARALSHNYPDGKVSVLIPGHCKSAGTLICIGAHELVIADRGELGPLDIQVQKPDEMFMSTSGLDIIRGLTYLQDSSLVTFRNYLIDINHGSGLSTKAASEIASTLTIGLYEPIFAQIDPMRLGEMQVALTIALAYGSKLNERYDNLLADALQALTSSYPSHGFVIDRKEARSLFKNVRCPDEHERIVGDVVATWFYTDPMRKLPAVVDFAAHASAQSPHQNQHSEEDENVGRRQNQPEQRHSGAAADNAQDQQPESQAEPADGCDQNDCDASKSQ